MNRVLWFAVAGVISASSATSAATPACPLSDGLTDAAKSHKIYAYFPTTSDPTFESFNADCPTTPVGAFDVTQLPAFTGSLSALQSAISDVLVDAYCEFNVQVLTTTTSPPTTAPRRSIIAVGTEACSPNVGVLTWGEADDVDTGNLTLVNYARVWAGSYQASGGGTTGVLNGAGSTVERWAQSIGGTIAHEVGHTLGLAHSHGAVVKPGEPSANQHLMLEGPQLSNEDRTQRRHFSDTEFSVLASNVGLSIQTMHAWDLVNPNSVDAHQLRVEFLSLPSSLSTTWTYAGSASPWVNPAVSTSSGTTLFKGTRFHRHRMTWQTGQNWSGGSAGVVPAGGEFQVGVTFAGVDFDAPDAILIKKVELLDATGNPLPLAPRLPGYDGGIIDPSDGSLIVSFHNMDPAAGDLILSGLLVQELPKVAAIDSLVSGGEPATFRGDPIRPWPPLDEKRPWLGSLARERMELRDTARVPLLRMAQGRHVYERVRSGNCRATQDKNTPPEVNECVNGTMLDLFPSTTILITATATQPNVSHWDRSRGQMVTGPLSSRIYYQISGRHPDLNENGRDDYLDIVEGGAPDENADGVPDDALTRQRSTPVGCHRCSAAVGEPLPSWTLLLVATLCVRRLRQPHA